MSLSFLFHENVQKIFNNWAFNRTEEKMKQHWEGIPDNTDVLITHSPPYMIRDFATYSDEYVGSPSLRDEVLNRIRPKIHCFGHIHLEYGITELNGIKFVNASCLNERYEYVNKPIVIEIDI